LTVKTEERPPIEIVRVYRLEDKKTVTRVEVIVGNVFMVFVRFRGKVTESASATRAQVYDPRNHEITKGEKAVLMEQVGAIFNEKLPKPSAVFQKART